MMGIKRWSSKLRTTNVKPFVEVWFYRIFWKETSRGCACPNGNRFEEFTKMSLEVLSDIGRKQIDEDKIGQVTLPSLKISICEVSLCLHRMPPNWSKPLCISKPVIQELSEFQEDPTLQNIILRVSKEFVPSFHHDQMFLLSVSMIHDENSFSHLHQWLDFDCFRMQTKLRTHSWLTFFAWVLQDCITWYPKGLIDLPIIYTTKISSVHETWANHPRWIYMSHNY